MIWIVWMEKQQHHKGLFVCLVPQESPLRHCSYIEEVVTSSLIIYSTCSDTISSVTQTAPHFVRFPPERENSQATSLTTSSFRLCLDCLLCHCCVSEALTMFASTSQCRPWQQASVCWVTCPTPPAAQQTAESPTLTWRQVLHCYFYLWLGGILNG